MCSRKVPRSRATMVSIRGLMLVQLCMLLLRALSCASATPVFDLPRELVSDVNKPCLGRSWDFLRAPANLWPGRFPSLQLSRWETEKPTPAAICDSPQQLTHNTEWKPPSHERPTVMAGARKGRVVDDFDDRSFRAQAQEELAQQAKTLATLPLMH